MGNILVNLKQCLVFSSIIVAVDPVAVLAIFQEVGVNNVLYFLVFGESLLNDAVTVVLYNMMKEFNSMSVVPVAEIFKGLLAFFITSLGGLSIGIVFGVLTAIITKYTGTVRVVEPLAVFVLAYTSYLMAEMFHFSGIISIIGCGLTQAQYAFHNISQKSHTTVKYFSKMLSSTSDCIIFLFLGIVLFRDDIQTAENWKVGFILWSIFLCLLYRFIVVFGLTWLVNRSSKIRRIDNEEKFIMAYGGLRGAVAFSLMDLLEIKDPFMTSRTKAIFMTTCLSIIFFTVFVQGISIKPLVKLLRVKLQEEKELKLSEEINSHVTDHVMAGIEEVLGQHGEHYFRELLEFYNRKYVKRMLMKDPFSMDEQIMHCFEEIALQQHFENLAGSKMIQEKYTSHDELPYPEDQLPSKITINLNDSIPEEEEDIVSSGEDSEEPMTILPAVTVLPPPSGPVRRANDIRNEEMSLLIENDKARRRTVANARKKSIIPDFFRSKSDRKPVSDEPTAKDLRAMFTPSRRMIQHRKLDKNIRDESSTDLLRFLQEKQNRTRRMSQAIGAFKYAGRDSTSPCSTPLGSDLHLNLPRKSIDAGQAMKNYRRRLSLAVPERPAFQRERSPSDVTALKSHHNPIIPPFRKPRFLKRGHSCDDRTLDSRESPKTLTTDAATLGKSPSRVSKTSGFESITEHDEDESGHSLDDTKSTISSSSTASRSSHKFRRPKLLKSKTIDLGHSSKHDEIPMQRSDTDPVDKKQKERSKVKFKMEEESNTKKYPKKSKLEKSASLDVSIPSESSQEAPMRSNSNSDISPGSPQLRKASYTQAISSNEVDDTADDVEMKNLKN
ncbi:hypothetical protein FSP39_013836 [Pinctada imbricata]|uniref:Sodium/hydrogen exchanger n=1 Tax=Pinctada imbricata TaxID=66713 RepID=A0AA89BYN6_PINIB|nr:hypothetical protein FSP39_013836 [Pinctada imbricata]